MSEPESIDLREEGTGTPPMAASRPRTVGAPLSMGVSRRVSYPPAEENAKRLNPPPRERAVDSTASAADLPSGVQRTVRMLRVALPLVQRLLPLLDGNVASAVSNLLAPRPQAHSSPPKVDLMPIEDGLAKLRSQQHSLRLQVIEQNTSLKRVEDQLEMVREAADRNTLEQQELIEDLQAFGKKVTMIAIVALVLAAAGFGMTLVLFLRINKILP